MPTEFKGWTFYEEMLDKEAGKSQGTIIATKVGSQHALNGIPCVQIIGQQQGGHFAVQSAALDYIYDYCIRCTQAYASTDTDLWEWMSARGYSTVTVKDTNYA